MLETIRQGTTTSATVIRTGTDEANRDAVIAATKNIVRKHLRAFSATIHDFHAAIFVTAFSRLNPAVATTTSSKQSGVGSFSGVLMDLPKIVHLKVRIED